jgi:hypothetical protein
MSQRSRPAVLHAAVVEKFLKLGGGGSALSGCQICFYELTGRMEVGNIAITGMFSNSMSEGLCRVFGAEAGFFLVQCHLRLNRKQPRATASACAAGNAYLDLA